MFRMIQEGGWPAMLSVVVGFVAVIVGIVALGALAASKRTAFVVGCASMALASLASMIGALGVAWGHRQVERALGMIENAAVVERILGMGYREAANCGTIGFAVALVPLVLGAIAALVGSRAPAPLTAHFGPMDAFRGPTPPLGPPPGPGWTRTIAALCLAGFALLCATGALATSFSRPPPGKYALDLEDQPGWHVAEARETIDIPGKREEGCDDLDAALGDLRSSRAGQTPVRFSREPDTIAAGTRAEATRCAREVFDRIRRGGGSAPRMSGSWSIGVSGPTTWTRDLLLDSALLLDDEVRKEVDAWSPPPRKRRW